MSDAFICTGHAVDGMPDTFRDSAITGVLAEVYGLNVSEPESVEPSRGFWRT